jgi:hypothetical protein
LIEIGSVLVNLELEPGTFVYALLLFVGVLAAVTVVNVAVLGASVRGAALRGVAIGFGAIAANWYLN